MRIGFDAKRLYSNFTGLGNYSRTLLQNLNSFTANNEFYLYTTKIKKDDLTDSFLSNKNYKTYLSKSLVKPFWRSFSIVNQLKKDKIELFHGLSHEIPFGIKKSGIKSVVTIHDLIFKVYPKTYPFLDRLIYNLKFKYACENSDRIIAISESTKKDIVKYYNIDSEKIDIVYQSCNSIFYNDSEKIDSVNVLKKYKLPNKYLLYVGSVTERKNVGLIVQALEYLKPEYKIPLVIVGNGKKHKEKLELLIAQKGLSDLVIWVENLYDNKELKVVYQKAKMLIYPSVYEGFGLPIAEALFCRTPVIASNISSLPEAGGKHSIYVSPNDAEELANSIEKVLGDNDLQEEMKTEGYKYAMENFSGKKAAENTLASYQKIIVNS